MRKSIVVLIFVVIGTLCIAAGITISGSTTSMRRDIGSNAQSQPVVQIQDIPGTIDGAKNPEKIPDHLAYAALFRMISNRHTEAEKNSIRCYVRQMGLGRQGICPGCPASVGSGDADIEAFIAAAEEFHQRVSIIDSEAAGIKDSTWPNPSLDVLAHLAQLQQQKEALAAEIAASLPAWLSAEAMQRVVKHINEHVKLRIKLIPEPATPPGGPGWQPSEPGQSAHHAH